MLTGDCYGEARIAYGSGEVAHARLHGVGAELDVGLAAPALQLPPTFMRQRSMASFRPARPLLHLQCQQDEEVLCQK